MVSTRFISSRAFFCGSILEEYIYERPIFMGGQSVFKKIPSDRIPKERSKSSLGRAKKQIRRLVNSNPQMNKFLTLTFAENITNLTQANYEFKKFKQKLERYTKRPLKYLCVPEFQKRGAVHFHIMSDMPFIGWERLSAIWGNGRIQIEKIRDKHKTGSYIVKYITKEKQDIRFYGQKLFFYPRKLLVKCVQAVDNMILAIKTLCYNECKLMQTYKIHNDYRGSIVINFYKLL